MLSTLAKRCCAPNPFSAAGRSWTWRTLRLCGEFRTHRTACAVPLLAKPRGLSLVFLRPGSIRTGIVLIQAFLAHSQVPFSQRLTAICLFIATGRSRQNRWIRRDLAQFGIFAFYESDESCWFHLFEPQRRLRAGLVKFLAAGCGLNEFSPSGEQEVQGLLINSGTVCDVSTLAKRCCAPNPFSAAGLALGLGELCVFAVSLEPTGRLAPFRF